MVMLGIVEESGDFLALLKITPLNLETLRNNAFNDLSYIDKFNSFLCNNEPEEIFCTTSGRYIWLIKLPYAQLNYSMYDLVPFIESISAEDVKDIVENSGIKRHRSNTERVLNFDFKDFFEYVLTTTDDAIQETSA